MHAAGIATNASKNVRCPSSSVIYNIYIYVYIYMYICTHSSSQLQVKGFFSFLVSLLLLVGPCILILFLVLDVVLVDLLVVLVFPRVLVCYITTTAIMYK